MAPLSANSHVAAKNSARSHFRLVTKDNSLPVSHATDSGSLDTSFVKPAEGLSIETIETGELTRAVQKFHGSLVDGLLEEHAKRRQALNRLSFSYEFSAGNKGIYLSALSVAGEARPLPPQQSRRGNAALSCGRFQYPLRRALDSHEFHLLSQLLLGREGESLQILERAVHTTFQTLRRKPPHEWTETDARTWECLVSIIDYDGYRELNPETFSRVGELIARDLSSVKIRWYGGEEEAFDLGDVPASIAGAPVGATISARLSRSTGSAVIWIDCSVYDRLKRDTDIWAENRGEIRALDDLPTAAWPRKAFNED